MFLFLTFKVFFLHLCNMNKNVIFFKKDEEKFSATLYRNVHDSFSKKDLNFAKALLWTKLVFYFSFFIASILTLYYNPYGDSFIMLIINYSFIGISGTLLAFNSSHDACHGTFSKSNWVNDIIFHFTFNSQGISARLWKIRHLASHHLFSNVDGCDADIDDNPFIRFSPNHPKKSFMKFQHLYSPLLYSLYLLIWIFIKDFVYLKKKNLANLKNQNYPTWYTIELVLVKAIYLFYILIIPIYFLEFSVSQILICYMIMLIISSNIFIYTLVPTHFTMETEFPSIDENGVLPYNFSQHQLITSMDFYPTSKFVTFLLGGFNCHAAHHLFPSLPHTIYPKVTPIIENVASKFGYKYNVLTLLGAIKSHFCFLKKLGS